MSKLWIPLIVAYLIGSTPFAYMLAKMSHGIDLRMVGDRNLGARNVYKNVSHTEGIMVGILDIGKGYIVIALGSTLGIDLFGQFSMGLMAILGHNWSIFLHFQGGQGVAATIGVLLGLTPQVTLFSLMVWALAYVFTRHWNLSSGIGLVLIPILSWYWLHDLTLSLYAVGLLPLIGIRKLMQNLSGSQAGRYVDNGKA